jgi:hypothetical protein
LATGAWPAQHGIVADTWFDRAARKPVRASEEALLATTLTAQIAAARDTRAYVISLDALDGALFAGTPAAQLFWMDEQGRFAARGTAPAWLPDYNRLKPLENLHNAAWLATGAAPGTPPLRTLTFDPTRPQEFLTLYKSSPYAQAAQFEFLGELMARERLGQGSTFDFVCLVVGSSALTPTTWYWPEHTAPRRRRARMLVRAWRSMENFWRRPSSRALLPGAADGWTDSFTRFCIWIPPVFWCRRRRARLPGMRPWSSRRWRRTLQREASAPFMTTGSGASVIVFIRGGRAM